MVDARQRLVLIAQVAESVDALVSNTSDSNIVPVRPRPWVQGPPFMGGLFYMAAVYVLYSESLDKYYIGSCLDLKVRLDEHLTHFYKDAFTRNASGWSVFWQIEGLSSSQAHQIEAHLKKMKSRTYLLNLSNYPEMASKLISRFPK